MKLIQTLAKDFEKNLTEIFEMEERDPRFLPQSDFSSCEERAKAFYEIAIKSGIRILAVAIANHRSKVHSDDVSVELSELSKGLTEEELKVGTQSWWKS